MQIHKRSRLLVCKILMMACLFHCFNASAQENASPVPTVDADEESTHDAIRKLRDDLLAAIGEKDIDAILSHLHDDVVLTMQNGASLSSVRKHSGAREYIDRLLTGDSAGVKDLELDVKVDELTILHGTDTGVAFGSSKDHYLLRSGGEFELATRWSATVVADGTTWKVASLHVSSNLFDNPVINATKSYLFLIGGIALGIGLLMGFVIARIMGRNQPN